MVRIGSSLRTQSRIAVDVVTGSSSRISPTAGSTAATGIGGTAHDDEANQGIAEAGNHPGQRERKQDKRDDIDETEPSGQQCQRGKTKRSRHGHDKQDGKSRPPGKQDLSGGVSFVHFCSRCGWRDRLRLLIQHRLVQITV